jgi:hypothetical protein
MLGGSHHGKSLPVKTQKCILAFEDGSRVNQQTRCAIFRGEAGVTLRNLDSRVVVNGELKPLHWLRAGDRIEFPGAVVLEVSSLGTVVVDDEVNPDNPVPNSWNVEKIADNQEGQLTSATLAAQETAPDIFAHDQSQLPPGCNEIGHVDSPLNLVVETPISPTYESRFQAIEVRLNQLADQVTSLITLASCGKFSSTAMPEAEWEQLARSLPEDKGNHVILNPQPQTSPTNHHDCCSTQTSSHRFDPTDFGAGRTQDQSLEVSQPAKEQTGWSATPNIQASATAKEGSGVEANAKMSAAECTADRPSIDPTVLTPERQTLEPLDSPPVSPQISSASGLESSLSDLLKSLGQSQSIANDLPASEAAPEVSQTSFAAPDLATPPQQQVSDLAKKFSTTGTTVAAQPGTTETSPVNTAAGSKATPSSSVEDEINAMLSRLFDKPMSPGPSVSLDQTAASSSSSSDRCSTVTAIDTPPSSPPDAYDQYSSMKFGYDLTTPTSPVAESESLHSATSLVIDQLPETTVEQTHAESRLGSSTNSSGQPSNLMDVLARLKQEGCWDDIDQAQSIAGTEASKKLVETQPEPSLNSSPAEPTSPASETISAESTEPQTDCVEDYMTKLLARMQVSPDGISESKAKTPTQNQTTPAASPVPKEPFSNVQVGTDLMTPEEFVPKQRAAKPQSFETMREIANTTARTAVAYSDLDRKKARGLMQMIIAAGALIMAFYYLVFVSEAAGDTAFVLGLLCLLGTAGTSFLGFKSLQSSGALKQLFGKRKD